MKIVGIKGNHIFSKCNFEGNNAANGAAINVNGQIATFQVIESSFINNHASVYGGAIIFANQSKIRLKIEFLS